jgi:hypothetical protein
MLGALSIDYSPFIDSLFAGPLIKNTGAGSISWATAITASCRGRCITRRISMINTSKLALIAVLAVMSAASPAFAQSFNKGDGTGNELPFAYGPGGTKPDWTVARQNEQIAVRPSNPGKVAIRQNGRDRFAGVGTSGLYDYAAVPFASGSDAANSSALTGGGSTGYNEMILRD